MVDVDKAMGGLESMKVCSTYSFCCNWAHESLIGGLCQLAAGFEPRERPKNTKTVIVTPERTTVAFYFRVISTSQGVAELL